MSNVINLFGGPRHGNAAVDVRPESHIETQPVEQPKPAEPKPPVYVRVRADVFQDAMNALSFYAGQGFDHGKQAAKVLNDVFNEPTSA